jgi:hypothetical protein
MQLMTHPDDQSKLLYTDVKFLKTIQDNAFVKVTPYSVPMFANHPYGTIVREFQLKARLPENAKNLSYVLNSGDDISEEDIAPYMNFMYNAKNPDVVNAMLDNYKTKHAANLVNLESTRRALGLAPMIPERSQAMYKVLTTYIKYPTNTAISTRVAMNTTNIAPKKPNIKLSLTPSHTSCGDASLYSFIIF